MIKKHFPVESETFFIDHSISILLKDFQIIESKAQSFGYTNIEYSFSINSVNYCCNSQQEIESVLNDNGVSELHSLTMDCKNDSFNRISIDFGGISHLVTVSQYERTNESHRLAGEILFFLQKKNLYIFKSVANIVLSINKIAIPSLFVIWGIGYVLAKLPADEFHSAYTLYSIVFGLIFAITIVSGIFSYLQKVRIIKERSLSVLQKYRDLIIFILGSTIFYFIQMMLNKIVNAM